MILIVYMINLLFYVSLCGFFLNYYYYLKSLMMVEFVMVSLFMVLLMSDLGYCDYIIYLLILSVCEGILGLLMVVLMCRVWGSDSFLLVDFNF